MVSTFLACQRISMEVQNHRMSVQDQFSLEGIITANQAKLAERTVKTWRTLLRSNFHEAIVSLSLFAWTSREGKLRPPFSTTLSRISATVLGSGKSSVSCPNRA